MPAVSQLLLFVRVGNTVFLNNPNASAYDCRKRNPIVLYFPLK